MNSPNLVVGVVIGLDVPELGMKFRHLLRIPTN